MKIVIYGGTFDPCHQGHIKIIETLSKKFDKVIVVPTTIRYYKINAQMFSFNERFENIKKRCEKYDNVEVSDIERDVDKDWRFIDTLRKLTSGKILTSINENEYWVAMGSDSFQKFKTWCDWEEILKRAKLIVFRRPNYENDFPTDIPYIYENNFNIDVSSSRLREQIREDLSFGFDEMIDDISFAKGYEEFLGDYNY